MDKDKRIAELEAAIRAVVKASRVEPMPSPWRTLDLAIQAAEKVLHE